MFSKRNAKRSSVWLQIACYFIFLSTIAVRTFSALRYASLTSVQDQVLALVRTYQAFAVHGGQRPDPTAYYADPANPLAAAKNSFNIVLTLISDVIIVRASLPSRPPLTTWSMKIAHTTTLRRCTEPLYSGATTCMLSYCRQPRSSGIRVSAHMRCLP